MMFVNMFLHDFKGIGVSGSMIALSSIAILLIVLFNLWIYKRVQQRFQFRGRRITVLIFLLFFTTQFMHIWAYDYNKKDITKYTPYFPYYFPTISHGLMLDLHKIAPHFFSKPVYNSEGKVQDILQEKSSKDAIFNYPIFPLQFSDSLNSRPNILLFLTESWRSDMMTQEVTPHIYEFSKNTFNYRNHTSSGNVTVSGLFGLFYGLHASYLSYAQANPFENQSLLTKALQAKGYDIAVYTPSNLDRFALKPMFFGAIKQSHYHFQKSLSAVENDRFVTEALIKDIKRDTLQKPWFKFIFLNASHHNYKYPEEHQIFLPVPTNSEGFIFDKNIDATPFINDYKNSLHYVDALFEEIIKTLKEQRVYDNTLIIVSSDHAEEFNDNRQGYWGHGSNFTKYQTAVPFLLKLPGYDSYKEINTASGHIDLVPTLLTYVLGVQNTIKDFSSGEDLLNLAKRIGFVMTSYVDKGYLIDANVYVNGLSFKSYRRDSIQRNNTHYNYKALHTLRKEETRFLQSK